MISEHGIVTFDKKQLATQFLVDIAGIKAYAHDTLVLQTKIWAKLNGLDETKELAQMRKKVNKRATANLVTIWEGLAGVLDDEPVNSSHAADQQLP